MKKSRVIKQSNIPSKLPIWSSLTTLIALDYYNAPQWLWGALGLIFIVGWIAIIYTIATQETVDLLNNDEK